MAKRIAIVGRPGVGKTTLAEKIAKEHGLTHVKTDDYIGKIDFESVPDAVLNDLGKTENQGYVVEGVQVARILRKSARGEKEFKPDKVIIVDANTGIDTRHKGLASLNEKAVNEWLNSNTEIEVERINNDLRGPSV